MDKIALVESIIFTTEKPLGMEELKKLTGLKEQDILDAISSLKQKYASEDSGLRISDTGGYKMIVKQEYMGNVAHLTPHADLSRGLLRTLSIIAYHQPIQQADIVKIVGNRTYQYVKELEARGFIKAEKKSRTRLLSTTKYFEDYFGTDSEKIKKIADEMQKKAEEKELERAEEAQAAPKIPPAKKEPQKEAAQEEKKEEEEKSGGLKENNEAKTQKEGNKTEEKDDAEEKEHDQEEEQSEQEKEPKKEQQQEQNPEESDGEGEKKVSS